METVSSPIPESAPMGKVRVRVDAQRCTGCRICESICTFTNFGEFNPKRARIWVVKMERMFLDVPVVCRQCTKPPCVEACPEDALVKDDLGILQVKEELCSGCEACIEACPFGAIALDPVAGVALACHMCRPLANGRPACVEWCPTGALMNGTHDIAAQETRWDAAFTGNRHMLRKWGIPLKEYQDTYGKFETGKGKGR